MLQSWRSAPKQAWQQHETKSQSLGKDRHHATIPSGRRYCISSCTRRNADEIATWGVGTASEARHNTYLKHLGFNISARAGHTKTHKSSHTCKREAQHWSSAVAQCRRRALVQSLLRSSLSFLEFRDQALDFSNFVCECRCHLLAQSIVVHNGRAEVPRRFR